MTAGKYIAETIFFRMRFFIIRLFYQVIIQGTIHFVGSCRIECIGDNS